MAGFRKNKRKKPFTPPTAATVNPNAATAATAAFSLSSAAAGAALRALPPPKTNVAEVQTKRTMRRSASVSSQGSRRAMSPVPSIKRMMGIGARGAADGGSVRSAAPPPTLRRRGSASSLASMASVTSMTERTFRTRTPSPGRAARGSVARASAAPSSPGSSIASSRTTTASTAVTAAGAAAAAAAGRTGKSNRSQSMPPPPPVPSIPKHVAAAASAADAKQTQAKQQPKQNRKSLQLAQQPLRLASEQQQAKAASGRSSWFGGAKVGNLADVRKSDVAMDISNYGNKTSITPPDERPSSRASSINFSYPSRQRLASPPASPTTTDKPISPPAAAQVVSRSMSTERLSTQHTAPRHKPAQGGSSGRRSASMSRVTDRTTTTHASGQTLVYDPNSRRFIPRAELLLEQSLAEAAEQSERQQHKKQQRHSTSAALLAGSHLAQEASPKAHKIVPPPTRKQPEPKQRQAPKPEAVATASPPRQQKQQRRPQNKQQDPAQATEEESARSPRESTKTVPLLATSQTGTETAAALDRADADATVHGGDHEASYTADSGRPALVKRPSVVREETEHEMEEDKQNQRLRPKRSSVALAQGPESSGSPSRNDTHLVAVPNGQGDITGNSPDSHLSVRRHSPPPRSISPRKSAMKHSSSPRDVSPSDSAASDANPASLALQPTSALSVQGAAARKKAHRVSFDEKAVVVPQESSQKPTFSSLPGAPESLASANGNHSPSPQRRTWFSNIGRSKKKGVELAAAAAGTAYLASSPFAGADGQDDDDDEIMKPRPALPSFGSVREKAQHAHAPPQEERPLVRPVHTTPSPSARTPTDTPAATPPPRGASRSPVADAPLGQHLETQGTSSDHAIGSILVSSLAGPSPEDQTSSTTAATRNTANTSRYREPLPPVVTSVDGSGYASDSGASNASIEKEAEDALLADDDESESNVGVADDTSVPRFDETRTTSYPTVLPAVIAEVPSDEENTSALEPSTAEASTAKAPKKVVPAIAITHPSQENLVAVRGEEGEEGGEEEQDSSNTKEAAETLSQTPAPPPTRHSPVRAFFDVPGTFPPDSDSDSTNKASPTKAAFGLGESTTVPTRQDTFEPIVQNDDSTVTAYTPATVYATHMPTLHEESSLHEQSHDESGRGGYSKDSEDSEDNGERDDESIYSDAYEDLSDAEGDGFQSLDAVVDSPISLDSKSHPFALPPALPSGPPSPKTKKMLSAADGGADAYGGNSVAANAWHASTGAGAKTSTAEGVPETNNAGDADWEKVRVFWHSLSSERRAQLEREASERAAKEEAAADGDLEEPTAAKKARRKKSAETRLAEKKALRDLVARNEGPHPAPPSQPQVRSGQPPSPKKISKRLRPSMRETAAGAGGGGVVAASATTPTVASNAQRARAGEAYESGRPQSAGGAVRMGHNRTLSSDSTSSSLLQKQKQSFLSGALRRRGSDSSESSFKRARGGGGGGGGGAQSDVGMGMRRTMRGESLDRGSSRFSLRSLSPTGSTTLRGGPAASAHAQSPHMPLTLRDKPAGAAGREKRALSASMTSATMRSHSVGAGDGGNQRLLPSLGRKGGSKLVRRGSSSRFGDSSDEDGDIFNIPRPASAGPASGAAAGASRRSASVGGATRAFRSRFDDSSDEDEIILDSRLRAAARQNRSTQRHVVPRTLRTSGLRGSSSVGGGGGGLSSKSLRSSDGGRPASRGGLGKRPMLPEALEEEEEEEEERYKRQTAPRPDAYMLRTPSGNIGTSTLRRSRSGRGQILPAAQSPTLSSTAMGAGGSGTRSTLRGKDAAALQVPPSHVQHRRMSSASSIMSVLRRKKPKDDGSGVGVGSFGSTAATMKVQRGELSDSAARRDTQLERSQQELALLRSNSQRRRQRLQRSGRAADDDDDDDDDELDSDLDSDLDSEAGAVNGAKKNGAKGGQAGGSWPLMGAGAGSSSGGTKATNSTGGIVSGGGVVTNGSGVPVKKKKFPALRRMFRLED